MLWDISERQDLPITVMRVRIERMETLRDLSDYTAGFRDEKRILGYCISCPRYGNYWSCPPYDYDPSEIIAGYDKIKIIATIVYPEDVCASVSVYDFFSEAREITDPEILGMEAEMPGSMAFYAGSCRICPGKCKRESGAACVEPDRARPSLESFGYDISRTLSDIFGVKIKWADKNCPPEYISLVSALMFR